MNFISIEYYIALALILLLLVLTRNYNKKYLLILLINYVFACLFGIRTLIVLLFITIYTYIISRYVIKDKKLLIFIFPIVSVVFKTGIDTTNIIVPIGLSFYGLQAIGYLVDISKDNSKYENDPLLLASALSFFPAMSSGPIEKLVNLMPRLKNDLGYNSLKAQQGVQLIAEGLFKRLVIANRIVDYVDKVYANPNNYNGLAILFAIVLYSIEIYCDFSAYSDIAIGSAKLIGIDLTNNFDNPYFSKSIKEFWRKWHISFSTWLKEYIYIPLGGNRVSPTRRIINVIITFVVSGLWHDMNITYFIWGLIHGLLNIIPIKKTENKFINCIYTVITFILVSLSWIFFKANNISVALDIYKGLFTRLTLDMNSISSALIIFTGDIMAVPYAITTFIMIMVLFVKEWLCVYKPNVYKENIYLCIVVICLILFGTNGSGAFIYQGF